MFQYARGRDSMTSLQARDLRQMARQLLDFADELDARSAERNVDRPMDDNTGPRAMFTRESVTAGIDNILLAREIYGLRRLREEIFDDPDLFGEPDWDMLIDLFIASETGNSLQTTSLCVGSCVAPTTALRWITLLEQKGLIERDEDPSDRRRSLIRLTAFGLARMSKLFTHAIELGGFSERSISSALSRRPIGPSLIRWG